MPQRERRPPRNGLDPHATGDAVGHALHLGRLALHLVSVAGHHQRREAQARGRPREMPVAHGHRLLAGDQEERALEQDLAAANAPARPGVGGESFPLSERIGRAGLRRPLAQREALSGD